MTAETPRVGDTVRLTTVHGDVTTIVTGPVESAFGALWVGGYRCHPAPDWTVDIIERAAPPEPPDAPLRVVRAEPGEYVGDFATRMLALPHGLRPFIARHNDGDVIVRDGLTPGAFRAEWEATRQ